MPQRDVFEELTVFFDDMPDAVRTEVSLLLVVLDEDQPVGAEGWVDCEQVARGLFNAQSRFGRFGDLIKAVGIFDVYFATDPYQRLAPAGNQSEVCRNRHAAKLAAIEKARRDWHALRQTSLTPAAISAALMPSFAPTPRHALRTNSRRSERQTDTQQAGL
jgi:hypothetical protein